jgi:hypothetical protein
METHVLHCVKANTAIIGGLTASEVQIANEVRGQATSGLAYRQFLSLVTQGHTSSFTTLDLKTALDAIGANGASIGGITGGLKFYFAQEEEEGPGFAAGSVHRLLTMTKGIVHPTRLNCGDVGDADLAYEATAVYDGSNAPIILDDAAALPTVALDQKRYALGPVTLGALVLTQKVNVSIEFGIKVETRRVDGDSFAISATISQVQPKIILRGNKVKWFGVSPAGIPLAGQKLLHATTKLYFRKRDLGGGFVLDATAEHVKITAAGLAVIDQPGSFTHGDRRTPGETTLTIETYHDGTNLPLIITTATAIT